MKIGFVGIGQMGVGMALNLVRAGHDLALFARRQSDAVNEVLDSGATQATTLEDLAASADIVVLCLTGTPAVKQMTAALMPGLTAGTLIIDTTTNDTDGPAEIAAMLAAHGGGYVEAPVAGGVKQAREGVLGAFVGADTADQFQTAEPVLRAFCKKAVHIGPVGMAARAKLVSNFLALGTATLVIEVFKQARSLGIEWEPLYELAQLGSGNSSGLQRIIGSAVEGDYKGYVFSVDNCLKDLGYLCDLGAETGTTSPLAPVLRQIHATAAEAGLGGHMISELLDPANEADGKS